MSEVVSRSEAARRGRRHLADPAPLGAAGAGAAARRRRVDARGRRRRRGSSRACASAGTRSRRSARRPTRAGSPSATSRTCCPRRDARHTLEEAAASTGLEPALIERLFLLDGLQRGRGRAASPTTTSQLLRYVAARARRRLPARRAAAARARVRAGARADRRRRGAPLPPLRARAADARRRGRRSRWPRRWRAWRASCCRSPRRSWTTCTSASSRTSSSRTSSGTWRPTSSDGALDLGRLRVAIAFADLAGYTQLTEEEGEEEAVSAVERFIEEVEVTLPDDARVIKTIGDEVMVVGSDAAALVDWAVGFQALVADERPLPRIGIHDGADALPRRRLLRPRGQPRRARRGARARAARCRHARGRRGTAGRAPGVRAHRRGAAEGLRRGDRAVPRPRAVEDDDG